MGELKIDYQALEVERMGELQQELRAQLSNRATGRIDSLQQTVLKAIVEGNYELAQSEVDRFISLGSDYAHFKNRCERYVEHCKDLINAIRAKRNFPGLTALSMSKQQELLDNVVQHFEELKSFLKKIEQIHRELRLDDLRSTVIVLQSASYTAFVLLGFFFLSEFVFGGMAESFNIVLDDAINDLLNRLFEYF